MAENKSLDELYEIRSRILLEHGGDLQNFMRDEFERLKSEGHPVAQISQRRIRHSKATSSSTQASR